MTKYEELALISGIATITAFSLLNTTCLCNKNNREFNIFLDFFKFNRPIFIIRIWKNKQHFWHLFPSTCSCYRNFICAIYKNYIQLKINIITNYYLIFFLQ